jgi:DNA-binding SARP family transcriptional activator/tetratricopeptide (TPR) repeat protein
MDALVQVLGPLEVRVGDDLMDLGGTRIRTLLGVLTVNAGRVTTVGTLVDALWGPEAPPGAHRSVRTYVSRLRQSLAPVAEDELALATHRAGYVLRAAPEVIDAVRFERLVAEGRAALTGDEPALALERLASALDLWHGDAYEEFTDVAPLRAEATRLHGMRLRAVEDRIEAELATGEGAQLVEELTSLTDRHPGHDRLWGHLMVALYRAGRQADALDVFVRARGVLVDRFGLDPSPRLVEVHQQVLSNDPRLAVPARQVRAARVVRNDLPGDIADFAGRRTELATLLTADEPLGTAMVIEAMDGMAGVGKTTLAVHAAHRLAERYPDAQLFIDLHGHTPSAAPIAPSVALDMLLRALGVPGEEIPNDLDARAARWRAELAARRVLVLLDNAADAAQVRPLLPGTPRSLTLITSRRRLVDLETAHTMSLDVLPEADAIDLFTCVVGADRVAGEEVAVREVVERCGYLPLAIRIAGARLRSRPAWTMDYLADRLRQARWPLAELAAGDRSVAAAFALSYEHLDEARRHMFRLLGVHPGPDIDAAAAASLAAVSQSEAGRLLEDLVDDHLVQQPVAGRYRLHDLVREHARAVADTGEPPEARAAALCRVVDFYLHTGYAGSRALDEQHPPIDIGGPAAGCVPAALTTSADAMAWFDANHQNVLAVRAAAEEAGWDPAVWQLAWTLDNFHYRRGHIHDNIASWRAGLAAAERLGDLAAQARAHRRLGLVHSPLGEREQELALHHLDRALTLCAKIGDRLGEAGAHFVLGLACAYRDEHRRALEHMTNAMHLYRDIGDAQWEVRALSMMGACHTQLGDYDRARDYLGSAMTLCLGRGDVYGQADTLDNLGAISSATGHPADALRHYEQALTLWHETDNTYRQAGTLTTVGDAHRDLGNLEQARAAWQRAVDLYRDQNLTKAAGKIEKRLTEL